MSSMSRNTAESRLTILFEAPFWVGLYERLDGGVYQVCKTTFGAEPRDDEVYEWLANYWRGMKFSPPVPAGKTKARRPNPKRMQRDIRREIQPKGMGTKAQQALKLQHEQSKIEHKTHSRAQKEAEQERRFALRQEKKKAKHKGK